MNHKQKVKLARKLQTKKESTTKGFGIFNSDAWNKRRDAITKRIANKLTQ